MLALLNIIPQDVAAGKKKLVSKKEAELFLYETVTANSLSALYFNLGQIFEILHYKFSNAQYTEVNVPLPAQPGQEPSHVEPVFLPSNNIRTMVVFSVSRVCG